MTRHSLWQALLALIQPVLQLNSDNYRRCSFFIYGAFDGMTRDETGWKRVYPGRKRPEIQPIGAALICSAAGVDASK
jgi:hypothetical protein